MIVATAALRPFLEETGALPQSVNFAVRSDYIRPLLEVKSRAPTRVSRSAAIENARHAICAVTATR